MMLERYDVIISEGAPDPMLPEVDGEWDSKEEADAYAALLTHRQGMEGQS